MQDLVNRHILVTGGSRGIGAATVALLDSFGADVTHISRGKCPHRHGRHIRADVTDPDQVSRAVEQAEAASGPLYGVVANAGIVDDSMLENMGSGQWDEVIATNLGGVFHTLRPIVPEMCKRGEGAVVVVSSIVGERGNVGQSNYGASKGAVIGLAKSLALECARYAVRVNAVSPGFIDTDMLNDVPVTIRERLLRQIPMKRFGTPNEIAWPIAFLLSQTASGFISGEVLRINGAHHT